MNNDVRSLADTQDDEVCLVWLYRNKVVGDHRHVVAINREKDDGFGCMVDQPQSVLLPSLELEVCKPSIGRASLPGLIARVVVLAVDQHVVRHRWAMGITSLRGVEDINEKVVIVVMEPVRQHDRANIDIVAFAVRTIDDYWTRKPVDILGGIVAVPPRRTIQLRTEPVGEGLARCNRTLRNTRGAIIVRSPGLQESVPVNTSSLLIFTCQLIVYSNLNPVTPIGLDSWTGKLAIDNKQRKLNTVRRKCSIGDCPVVLPSNSSVWNSIHIIGVAVLSISVAPRSG